jgi:hypothetical protein
VVSETSPLLGRENGNDDSSEAHEQHAHGTSHDESPSKVAVFRSHLRMYAPAYLCGLFLLAVDLPGIILHTSQSVWANSSASTGLGIEFDGIGSRGAGALDRYSLSPSGSTTTGPGSEYSNAKVLDVCSYRSELWRISSFSTLDTINKRYRASYLSLLQL